MTARKGRKAYPGRSIDSYMNEAGLTGSLIDCMRSATIDGKRLTAARDIYRTPHPGDLRPEAKYDEAFIAVTAACNAGMVQVAISTTFSDGSPREAPDVLLRAKNHPPVEVEVVIVDETRPVYVRLLKVHAVLQAFVYNGRRANQPVGFTVVYEKVKSFSPKDFDILAAELVAFWRAEMWRTFPPGRHAAFADGSTAARAGTVLEVGSRTYATLLTFAQVNGVLPLEGIRTAITAKQKLTYHHEHDLWLVVHVGDPRGPFREALEEIARSVTDFGPFSRIIVADGHYFVTLAAQGSAYN